ncbi:MAG TPA: cell wall-binding repeat-containing protein [Thermoleophilaceae bacterium]
MTRILPIAVLCSAVALAGCSLNDSKGGATPDVSAKANDSSAAQQLGLPLIATKNTTRVSGADPATDAAGVVSAVFPSTNEVNKPRAIALVDKSNWAGAVAAGVLMSRPLEVPMLVSDGGKLPSVTKDTLGRLKPGGSPLAKNAQVIRVGDSAANPGGLRTGIIHGKDPYTLAAAVDRFWSVVRGKPSPSVVIASGERADFAMAAGAWAARSGDAVLFTQRNTVPAATLKAIRQHSRPSIVILGPDFIISKDVEKQLGKLGKVSRIDGPTPVQTAIALARTQRGGVGWGITVPGQNFTIANSTRPMDAAAAAPLAGRGVFAPLLLTDQATSLPNSLESYLLDVQPGFENNPNAGVYNHVWILGDKAAVSLPAQGRIDQITELVPVQVRKP